MAELLADLSARGAVTAVLDHDKNELLGASIDAALAIMGRSGSGAHSASASLVAEEQSDTDVTARAAERVGQAASLEAAVMLEVSQRSPAPVGELVERSDFEGGRPVVAPRAPSSSQAIGASYARDDDARDEESVSVRLDSLASAAIDHTPAPTALDGDSPVPPRSPTLSLIHI